jgi:hypothetical protein
MTQENMMKALFCALVFCLFACPAFAGNETCQAQADAKKLAGAALNSFMTKCEKDAQSACDSQAAEKKLSGAAKDSFTKKCVSDAVGKSG